MKAESNVHWFPLKDEQTCLEVNIIQPKDSKFFRNTEIPQINRFRQKASNRVRAF